MAAGASGSGGSSTVAGVSEQPNERGARARRAGRATTGRHRAGANDDPRPTRGDGDEPELPSFMKDPAPLDTVLFVALLAMGLFSLAMIPLRAWLLSHPLAYSLLVGGYTSATVAGANASVGNGAWWPYLLASLFGALKFVPLYWLMGRRWGMEFIDMSLQYMPRAHRFFRRAVKNEVGTTRAITLGLLPLGFAPGPVPGTVLNAVAGMLKVGLGLLMAVNVASVLAVNGLFMWLGHTFGEEVLDVVAIVNRYLLWVTLGLLAVVIIRARKRPV